MQIIKKIEELNRVRRPVNPTNHVKHGIRQVLFPYKINNKHAYIKLTLIK